MNKLYEILAALQYNSERREPLEGVLARFLTNKNPEINVVSEVRDAFNQKMKNLVEKHKDIPRGKYLQSELFKTEWFKQESLLLSNVSQSYVPEYVMGKFEQFEDEFRRIYHFDFGSLWLFSYKFAEYLAFKKMRMGFADRVYAFKSKKEYADLGFVEVPSSVYIEQWKNIVTTNKKELRRLFFGFMNSGDLDRVLDILSISLNKTPYDANNIHFPSTPFLQTDDEIILMTPSYLGRSLHTIYEGLFKKCKSYLDSKGSTFENIVQNLFRQTLTELMVFNVEYGEKNQFEADAIVAYKKSLWISEASSHPPSKGALKGDLYHVRKDLNRTLKKCHGQGKRALQNLDTISLPAPYKNLGYKGIIIVVDGVYPNLNLAAFNDLQSSENVPLYVINYFDFRTLLDQPEIKNFEEFLLWRTQRPMPIICFDEKDYWNYYFDRYMLLEDERKTFKTLQEKRINLIYSGYRFNRKDYLARMPRDEK